MAVSVEKLAELISPQTEMPCESHGISGTCAARMQSSFAGSTGPRADTQCNVRLVRPSPSTAIAAATAVNRCPHSVFKPKKRGGTLYPCNSPLHEFMNPRFVEQRHGPRVCAVDGLVPCVNLSGIFQAFFLWILLWIHFLHVPFMNLSCIFLLRPFLDSFCA